MPHKSTSTKVIAVALWFLTLVATAPFSLAETLASTPLGSLISPGGVSVHGVTAPSGTTIFDRDHVVTGEAPALINFSSGSRIEMTKAAASFARQGETLVVQANTGLLRFNFRKGETVLIKAGRYHFATAGSASHVGELGLNQSGQTVMTLSQGVLAVANTANGEKFEVTVTKPLVFLDQSGQGTITRGRKTLTDTTKSFKPNELKGKCVVAGGEAYLIESNNTTTLMIKGAWKLTTGTYDYKITDCSKDSLIAAGATAAAAGSAAAIAAAAAGVAVAAAGVSAATIGLIVAGVAAVATVGGLAAAGVFGEKSPSSR